MMNAPAQRLTRRLRTGLRNGAHELPRHSITKRTGGTPLTG
jgi:hypothetical protein